MIQLYRWFPSIFQVLTIVQPETLVRWHRAGFRCYWRWKSRPEGGRSQIETNLRALIRRMSIENPLWGAPRIHGELLKLGFDWNFGDTIAAPAWNRIEHQAGSDTVMFSMSDENLMRWARYYRIEAMS